MLETTKDTQKILARDLMSCSPKTIKKEDLLYDAFSLMKQHSITQLLVISKNKYLGIIHLHDILKYNIF